VAPCGISARQFWAEPDLCQLSTVMREVFRRSPGRNSGGRGRFEKEFGYDTVGSQLAETLTSLKGQI
jgi:hypothetical protein